MIKLPVFKELHVTRYGLYPGKADDGLHIDFLPGLTLVIGANGLGKSTLINIAYRLLTGPFDISGLSGKSDTLGNIRVEPSAMGSAARAVFAGRVVDNAKDAKARIVIQLGDRTAEIERRLAELSLTSFKIDGISQSLDEAEFQKSIANLVGVWSFGDWILVLRYLVFYFEDRRALVWDATAQKQILRFLFPLPEVAEKWTKDERDILQLDSLTRNLNYALGRQEKVLSIGEAKEVRGADVHNELKTLEGLQDVDDARREALSSEMREMEAQRQQARGRLLQADQDLESKSRELERAKLVAIGVRFPKTSETARYIVAQLLSETHCLVCDNEAPQAAVEYERRLQKHVCVVCGTNLQNVDAAVPAASVADKRVDRAAEELRGIEINCAAAKENLSKWEAKYREHLQELQILNSAAAARAQRIESLIKQLPPGEAALRSQRSDLAALRTRVESMTVDLNSKRTTFRAFVEQVTRDVAAHRQTIEDAFDGFAQGFLREQCKLVWSPKRDRVGETGEFFEFPAFELEMTGSDYPTAVRRTGPEQVSESQREFIDLAFRMALMSAAGVESKGSLVIDAPESSLDAVFVNRAAQVLGRFAEPGRGNSLVLTSNLVEGNLIPSLIRNGASGGDREKRIVDLFELATPTAAVRDLRAEYDDVKARVLGTQAPTSA